MHILNQIFKVLLRFVIIIAIVAGVLAIALTLNVISYITLRDQSYDWYNYIATSSMEYMEKMKLNFGTDRGMVHIIHSLSRHILHAK